MTIVNGVEPTDLPPTIHNLIAITDITTNGSAKDINQVYTVVNDGLDDYKRGVT